MANLQEYRTMTNHMNHSGMIGVLDTVCCRIEDSLVFVSAAAIIVAMLVTFFDVVMRYVFKSPVSWVFDLITMYLLPGSYFLAFSYALRTGNHLKVDYFKNKLPEKIRSICIAVFGVVAVAIFVFISYAYAVRAYEAWESNEVIYGAVNWVVWPSDFIIAISAATFSFRLIIGVLETQVKKGEGML